MIKVKSLFYSNFWWLVGVLVLVLFCQNGYPMFLPLLVLAVAWLLRNVCIELCFGRRETFSEVQAGLCKTKFGRSVLRLLLWCESYVPPELHALPFNLRVAVVVGLCLAIVEPGLYIVYLAIGTTYAVLYEFMQDEKECNRIEQLEQERKWSQLQPLTPIFPGQGEVEKSDGESDTERDTPV